MRTCLSLASLIASTSAAAPGPWPHLCTPPSPNYTAFNETRCPIFETCAPNPFSLSGWGCAPHANATICNNFQSCPGATTCQLANGSGNASDYHSVYRCVGPTGVPWGSSRCSCKPGAPLPPSPTLKNVLIIGDSISIGYTPFVAQALAGVAQVQHAPFSGDGGAEESAYSLQCGLTHWLASPSGVPIQWDLIYLNNGMHNTGEGAAWIVPGQSGEPAAYGAELAALTQGLLARAALDGARTLFGITSPMLCNASIDSIISSTLNPTAAALMGALGVPTVDLYAAITAKCGAVPTAECFGLAGCFCPHCNNEGYAWLATEVIAPAIRKVLGV